jgi:hypothetical protein
LIFRTLDALRIFDLPFVLTGSERDHDAVARSRSRRSPRTGSTARLGVLDPHVHHGDDRAFIYIRTVGGNIRGLAKDYAWRC